MQSRCSQEPRRHNWCPSHDSPPLWSSTPTLGCHLPMVPPPPLGKSWNAFCQKETTMVMTLVMKQYLTLMHHHHPLWLSLPIPNRPNRPPWHDVPENKKSTLNHLSERADLQSRLTAPRLLPLHWNSFLVAREKSSPDPYAGVLAARGQSVPWEGHHWQSVQNHNNHHHPRDLINLTCGVPSKVPDCVGMGRKGRHSHPVVIVFPSWYQAINVWGCLGIYM